MKLCMVVLLVALLSSAGAVGATTLQGQRVDITGANDAGATGDYYLRTYVVPLLGTAVGIAGLGSVPSYGLVAGGTTAAAGVAMIFWPNIVSTSATSASAATLGMDAPGAMASWGVWLQTMLGLVALTGLAYVIRQILARVKEVFA